MRAQVRIGGNGAPNAAAVLDLNATDATNNGTKGLALPRVSLTSNTMQLTSGVANLTGMLVYNTTATLSGAGIYFWNSATWVRGSMPEVTPADSGKYLMVTTQGTIIAATPMAGEITYSGTAVNMLTPAPVITWHKIVDATIYVSTLTNARIWVPITGITSSDFCETGPGTTAPVIISTAYDGVRIFPIMPVRFNTNVIIRCYRPS